MRNKRSLASKAGRRLVTWLISYLVGLVVLATPVSAAVLSIQQLPAYIDTNNFKLSCTSDGGVVDFEVSKGGGAFTTFASVDTDSNPCVVQVTSSVVNDQTDYIFRAGGKTTSTFYDISGPSPVSGYYKEKVGDGFYKLHWKNPGDSDFSKVVIYRGETADFPADNSHEIARVSGGANSDMTYDEHQPDPAKTYYYAIRALDKADNSSSLVGDQGTTTTTTTATGAGSIAGASTATTGQANTLPVEEGQVLSEETAEGSPDASPVASDAQNNQGFLPSGRNKILAILGLAGLGVLVFYFLRRRHL